MLGKFTVSWIEKASITSNFSCLPSNLAAALPKIETLRLKGPAFPPQTDADALETAIAGILDRLCLNEILSHGTRGGKLEM